MSGTNLTMEDAGQKLKKRREQLDLRFRDVEDASQTIAEKHGSDEYLIGLSRLSDIENKGAIPSIFRLYALCVIYRLDFLEVLEWYGIDLSHVPADAALVPAARTHPLDFRAHISGSVPLPLTLDPGIDLRRTTFLSRMIQRWGKLPLLLLNSTDPRTYRYAYVGTDDWSMYPLIHPGALLLVDESKRRIQAGGWTNELDRPIYLLEHRDGFHIGWCTLQERALIVQPHPASEHPARVYAYPDEIDVIGQVSGVAMRLEPHQRSPR